MSLPSELLPVGLLGTGAAAEAEGYTIERSVRFNSADSAYLSRTPASAGNRKTWTWAGWVKRSTLGGIQMIFSVRNGVSNTNSFYIAFLANNQLTASSNSSMSIITSAVLRDPSAWYHITVVADTTQATAANRLKIYINGVQITAFSTAVYPTQNDDTGINQAFSHQFGRLEGVGYYFNGYLADVFLIDGQALDPTSFGEFDDNGIWQPIAYTGSYGTNGFHLDFADNSSAAALGYDAAGSNDWTVNNLSVTAGAGNDSLVDSPTNYGTDTGAGGEVRGNYCTINPLANAGLTLSNGNLDFTSGGGNRDTALGTISVSSGKWYWELNVIDKGIGIGIELPTYYPIPDERTGNDTAGYNWWLDREETYHNGSSTAYGAGVTTGDVIGVALDLDGGTLVFYKNGVSQGTAYSGISGSYVPSIGDISNGNSATGSLNFGQRPFAYTAPSGFKALCTANLPAPVVTKPSDYFDILLWTGDGSASRSISLPIAGDLVWAKKRSATGSHQIADTVRGDNAVLLTNNDFDDSDPETGFVGGGIVSISGTTVTINEGTSDNNNLNLLNGTHVAWTWDAGSSNSTNTDGSITSTVRANASAGFSIVTYTGDGAASATIGHGLGVAPQMIMVKNRDVADEGAVYHVGTDATSPQNYFLKLFSTSNGDAARSDTGAMWNDTAPTSTVFSVGTEDNVNASTEDYVAYCFTGVSGYGNSFSYTGNGNADGPFQYLGFLPKLILIKCSSTTGDWVLLDTEREGYNVDNDPLFPNLNNAEATTDLLDITSNGFKLRSTNADVNANAATYIGYAWAEAPFNFSRAR